MATSLESPAPAQVRVVMPSDDNHPTVANGAKVFINGIEFENLSKIHIETDLNTDDAVKSTIVLTFYGDILVERSSAK